jgi:hypothetical protein
MKKRNVNTDLIKEQILSEDMAFNVEKFLSM